MMRRSIDVPSNVNEMGREKKEAKEVEIKVEN